MGGWVGPVAAISLAIIAASFVAIAVAVLVLGRRAAAESQSLGREMAELRRDLGPTIQALTRLTATGEELSGRVKEEVQALLDTSRRVRRGVSRGVRRVRGRLEELDALYEVVHEEVQETALNVAATLRSFRSGTSALQRIRRFLVRGRR